jgi:hypothetical protein
MRVLSVLTRAAQVLYGTRMETGIDGHPERAMIEQDFDGIMFEMEGA